MDVLGSADHLGLTSQINQLEIKKIWQQVSDKQPVIVEGISAVLKVVSNTVSKPTGDPQHVFVRSVPHEWREGALLRRKVWVQKVEPAVQVLQLSRPSSEVQAARKIPTTKKE